MLQRPCTLYLKHSKYQWFLNIFRSQPYYEFDEILHIISRVSRISIKAGPLEPLRRQEEFTERFSVITDSLVIYQGHLDSSLEKELVAWCKYLDYSFLIVIQVEDNGREVADVRFQP